MAKSQKYGLSTKCYGLRLHQYAIRWRRWSVHTIFGLQFNSRAKLGEAGFREFLVILTQLFYDSGISPPAMLVERDSAYLSLGMGTSPDELIDKTSVIRFYGLRRLTAISRRQVLYYVYWCGMYWNSLLLFYTRAFFRILGNGPSHE